MDVATVVGLLLGVSLLVITVAIAPGASFGAFIDYPSMMVVVGGCIAAVLTCFPLKAFLNVGRVFKNVLFNKAEDISKIIDQSIRTLVHSRLELAVEELRNDAGFKGDLVVMEPAESDAEYFSINPLWFWKRAEAARHGFITIARDMERNLVRLQGLFGKYGLETDMARLLFLTERLGEADSEDKIVDILASPPVPSEWRKHRERSG